MTRIYGDPLAHLPFEHPIGVSGDTPEEALAKLHEAVREWASTR